MSTTGGATPSLPSLVGLAIGGPATAGKRPRDESDESDDDEEDADFGPARAYPNESEPFVFLWELDDAALLDVLCQFVALHAYQMGNSLSEMVRAHYQSDLRSMAHDLRNGAVFDDIETLPCILALMHVKATSGPGAPTLTAGQLERLKSALPSALASHITSGASLRSKLRVVESTLLLIPSWAFTTPTKRLGKRLREHLEEKGATSEQRVIDESVAAMKGTQRRSALDRPPREDARLVLEFVCDGLQAAFGNPEMRTLIPEGTVLWHGSSVECTPEQIARFTRGYLSTTTNLIQAFEFFRTLFGRRGCVLRIVLQTPLSVITYASLDRAKTRVWDRRPVEKEVLLPRNVVYNWGDKFKKNLGIGAPVYLVTVEV